MKRHHIIGILIIVLAGCTAARSPENPYDTDLSILHLDVSLKTDFAHNCVQTLAVATVKNFSAKAVETAEFWICPGMNDPDLSAEIGEIARLDPEGKKPVGRTVRAVADRYNPGYQWEIYSLSFDRAIRPGETIDLEFSYVMTGRSDHSSTPIWMSENGIKELFLRGDFYWCPSVFAYRSPGVFPKRHDPSWELNLEYPRGYIGIADGRLVRREEEKDLVKERWTSLINGFPQVFISTYKVERPSTEGFTLEIYAPDPDLVKKAALRFDEYKTIFQLFSGLYGRPGPTTYRIVGSPVQQGGNGLVMGQVIAMDYLRQPERIYTIAHELAHTWWGTLITSFGEGSKFLREAVGDFSALWAIRELQGEDSYRDRLSRLKNFLFYGYFTNRVPPPHFPLIQREGYDPARIIGANYTKGPFVVNQIRLELGDDLFFRCLGTFARENMGKKVDVHDFIATFNRVSGRDLTPLFKDLLWGTGYPAYRLEHFSSTPEERGWQTIVRIRNDGPFGLRCPLLLKTTAGEIRKMFHVEGTSTEELRFATSGEVVEVVIDPDSTGYHFDLRQKAASDERDRARKAQIDVSTISSGNNWGWFNASYIRHQDGDHDGAIEILSRYFLYYMKIKGLGSIEEMAGEPFNASYIFTRGLYYLADGQNDRAEADFKMAVAGMINSFSDGDRYPYGIPFSGWISTGLLMSKGNKRELASLLGLLTGRDFPWDDDLDKSTKGSRIENWRQWWDKRRETLNLDLEAVRKRYKIQADHP